MKRRKFIYQSSLLAVSAASGISMSSIPKIMTVNGPVDSEKIGVTLSHEHILVDFVGAAQYDSARWDRKEVVEAVLPYLMELKQLGCESLFEFTPEFLGRDPLLLKDLSQLSGLNIITNTGYYGAVDNKYLPQSAFSASAQELSDIWVHEFKQGIKGTGIRPGFIKISVNPESLSDLHRKLVEAAGITHLQTGLTIASHTGPSKPAFEQLELLQMLDVHGSAFIWVHAQNEKDKNNYLIAARKGAWISLDGIQEENIEEYLQILQMMKEQGFLHKVLISQDAGWYEPGNHWNGPVRDYTVIFKHLIPRLRAMGFNQKKLKQLLEINPQKAFSIGVRTF